MLETHETFKIQELFIVTAAQWVATLKAVKFGFFELQSSNSVQNKYLQLFKKKRQRKREQRKIGDEINIILHIWRPSAVMYVRD